MKHPVYGQKSTDHKAPNYAVSSIPHPTSPLLGPQFFLSTLLSNTLNPFLPHYQRSCLRPHKTGKITYVLILIFIFLEERVRTTALISSGEVTGVQTQDVQCLPSIWIAAAVVVSQPGDVTVNRTWKQAETPNQRSDSYTVVHINTGLPLIVLPSIYTSHILRSHNSFVIVTTHHGLRLCSGSELTVLTNKHPHLVLPTGKELRLSKALPLPTFRRSLLSTCRAYLQAVERQTNQRRLHVQLVSFSLFIPCSAGVVFFIYSTVPVDVITNTCLLTYKQYRAQTAEADDS